MISGVAREGDGCCPPRAATKFYLHSQMWKKMFMVGENDAKGRGKTFEGVKKRVIVGRKIQASKKTTKIFDMSIKKSQGCGRHPSYATEYDITHYIYSKQYNNNNIINAATIYLHFSSIIFSVSFPDSMAAFSAQKLQNSTLDWCMGIAS